MADATSSSPVPWSEVIVGPPTYGLVDAADVCTYRPDRSPPFEVNRPLLVLACSECGGEPRFAPAGGDQFITAGRDTDFFLIYLCRDCQREWRSFALCAKALKSFDTLASVLKYGQHPPAAELLPKGLLKVVGSDRALLRRARQCELSGFGIGAAAYYRRVLEDHWGELVRELRDAATAAGASDEQIAVLNDVARDWRFANSVQQVEAALPKALLIGGRNPIVLLHGALSAGMHARSEAECLEMARDVLHVLQFIFQRSTELLREDVALRAAVRSLESARKPRTG